MIEEDNKTKTIYHLHINSSKNNVFISLINNTGQLLLIRTPGLILKEGVTRTEYEQLSSKLFKRKKKSLRKYINSKKRTKIAAIHTLRTFLKDKKFKFINSQSNICWVLNILGSNFWLSQKLIISLVNSKIIKSWWGFRHHNYPPHNGTKLKIRKRKKNKGVNKGVKRLHF